MDVEPVKKKKRLSKGKSDGVDNELAETNLDGNDDEVPNKENFLDSGKSEIKRTNFDAYSLRKRLREDTALQAVKLLIAACEVPGGDPVKDYIEAGGGPLELLHVINKPDLKKNPIHAGPVFSAVQLVVVKILSDFPLLHKSAEEACCYLLREFMPTLHLMLVPSASVNHKIVALKLLTSVVSLSIQLARDVLNSVNLEFSHVEHLAAQISPHDRKSVRATFIHFILSFIVEGNSYIIRQLFQNKGLLRLVTQDLVYDNGTTVMFLLNALRDKVVSSQMIPKSLKIHCFNTAVLLSLLELYNWLGPKHWVSKKSLTEDRSSILFKGDEEERSGVRECVHSLFLLLCTSHKLGIAFCDRNIGTGQCQNVIIRTLFKAIEKQWEDDLVKELTRSILLTNPDLITSAFNAFKKIFEPRSTKNWLSTVVFISQVTEQLDPKLCLPDHLSIHQIIKLIKNLCLPSPVLQTVCSEESFTSKDLDIRGAAVKCLVTCIKKLNTFISFTKYPSKDIVPGVVNHLNQVGPKIDWVVSAWKMGTATNDDSSSLKELTDVDYNIYFVELVLLIHKISPDLLESANEWSDDLISSSLLECSRIGEDHDPQKVALLKLETLKMVSVLKTLTPTEEAFSVCAKMLIELMKMDFKEEAKAVFGDMLLSTGLLEGVEDEVEIWLHCLMKDKSNVCIIDLFLDIFKEAALNTAHHFKTISDACSGASSYTGKSTSNIDDIITLLQDEDDDDEGEGDVDLGDKGKQRCNIVRNQQSISPLVSAMLRIISNKKWFQRNAHNEEVITAKKDFITAVLVHSLHRQTYPERLRKLLPKDLVGVATAAFSYISSWTEPGSSPHPLTFTPFSSDSVESKLSRLFLQKGRSSKLTSEVLGLLEKEVASESNSKLLLHLCVFYITQLHQQNYVTSEVLQNSAKVISKLLSLMDNSSRAFNTILEGVLVHPVIVNMFQPMKKDIYVDLTQIVLLFIEAANSCIKDQRVLSDILLTCKKKLLKAIIKALKKQKTSKLNLVSVVQEFSLTEEEIQTVFSYLIKLPSSIKEDGWLEIEALLFNKAAKSGILLSEETFSVISNQITDSNGRPDCLQIAFKNYVQRFPHYMKFIQEDLFLKLVNEKNNGTNLELAKLLLSSDKKLVNVLKENLPKTSSLLFPLLSVVDCNSFDQNLMEKLIAKQITQIQEGIFNQVLWFTQHSTFVSSLIRKYLDNTSKKKLYGVLKSRWSSLPQQSSVLEVLKSVELDDTELIYLVDNLLGWISDAFSNSLQDGYKWLYDNITDILHTRKKCVNWSQLLDHENCNNVMRLSLKWGLRRDTSCSLSLMKMLVTLCSAVFSSDNENQVARFFDLVISHSDFISVMLENNDITCQAVELLLVLLKINPKLTLSSHVPIYLSAYGATLSETDQKILELLQLYENNGSSVWEWRPCLWGPTAANFYSVHSKSAQPLWRQPRMSQVLDLLDRDVVDMTITKFPLKRSLQAANHINLQEGSKIYDPAFILPLLTHLLAPGADVQHRSMVNSGALAIALASLGSFCGDLRSVAYLVLTRFHSHLSSGESDQQLWLNFINAIRCGVLQLDQEYPQTACIISTFLARASSVISNPQHLLFSVLHNFILAKPALSLTAIPAFLELMQSKDVRHREHQEWLLKVLRDGTRQKADMKLLFQSLAFKILMTLYSFVHTPKDLKILIIEIFSSCVSIQDAGYVLTTNYGLISWINHCLITTKDYDEVSHLIKFLEKVANFKNCSFHVKLISIALASDVTSVCVAETILKILCNNKIIGQLSDEDVKIVISMSAILLGSSVVQKAKDMLEYGCEFVTDISDPNVTVSTLNKLVFDWLHK